MRLIASHAVQADLVHYAKTGYPEEICGLLAGHGEQVLRVIPTDNIASDKQGGFLIPQSAFNDHLPKIRAEGLSLIGFYHSHPNTPPIPSPTDVRELDNGLKLPHVIIGIAPQRAEIKAWMVKNGQVDPIEWVVGDIPTIPLPITTNAQTIAFVMSAVVSLMLLITIALTLLPPAPPLP